MPESPFISEADRNTIAVASDTYCALLELGRLVDTAIAEAKEATNLLRAAACSERPAKREEAYKACRTTERSARAAFELAADVDNDAGTLRAMSHNLAHNHDE
jgi:hypothetical protein